LLRKKTVSGKTDQKGIIGMLRKLAHGIVLGIMVTLVGLILQCASDRNLVSDTGKTIDGFLSEIGLKDAGTKDGSIRDVSVSVDHAGKSDRLLDSIGPKADAAGDASTSIVAKRTDYSGTLAPGNKTQVCNSSWTTGDLPSVSIWFDSIPATNIWLPGASFSCLTYYIDYSTGCLIIKLGTSCYPITYKLVVIS
jgi:hypothetical protein